tara:strand:+ start:120863 stop:122098 length:1236 start_codon:yes stop_codon:yes gene_type:complete
MLKRTLVILLSIIPAIIFSQDVKLDELKIYLDCNICDNTYIKQNLGNVQFVRDQNLGDVHLFFVTQQNGSGGRLYEIDFIGKNTFENIKYKLSFSTDTNMTNDDVRNQILDQLKLGLVRYWIEKGATDSVSVNVDSPENNEQKLEENDPWDYWVFGLGANGYFNGQETNKYSNLNGDLSIKRVTEENKFLLRLGIGEDKSTFTYGDEDIIAINSNKYLFISDVLSINDNWSYGFFADLGASTYSNKDFYWSLKPALEYNFFEYKQSAKKQLTLSYRNGIVYQNYIERTIFAKEKETLWEHELNLGGSINQEWGNIFSEASFRQYLHDTTLNSLSFYLGANIRIFKGFNFNINGSYSITRNQVNLPAGNVSLEELLLQQQQLQSGYNYYASFGFNYAFGSIYNTIVNPRFNF